MFFQPNHPLMMSCLEQSLALGSSTKFAETGPLLITPLVEALDVPGLPHRRADPLYFSEVTDLLRPSRTEALLARIGNSAMPDLWNSVLRHDGVDRFSPARRLAVAAAGRTPWRGGVDRRIQRADRAQRRPHVRGCVAQCRSGEGRKGPQMRAVALLCVPLHEQ